LVSFAARPLFGNLSAVFQTGLNSIVAETSPRHQLRAELLVAVITSQLAGAWLEHVLHRSWLLLSGDKIGSAVSIQGDDTVAAWFASGQR
jgi:hypothetical protein